MILLTYRHPCTYLVRRKYLNWYNPSRDAFFVSTAVLLFGLEHLGPKSINNDKHIRDKKEIELLYFINANTNYKTLSDVFSTICFLKQKSGYSSFAQKGLTHAHIHSATGICSPSNRIQIFTLSWHEGSKTREICFLRKPLAYRQLL